MRRRLWICVAVIFIQTALIVAYIGLPIIMKNVIADTIAIKNGSEAFDRWRELPIPMLFKVYLFEVQNPDEVVKFGHNPILKQRGPFVYNETRKKNILSMSEEEDRATYMLESKFEFVQSLSTESDQAEIMALNAPAVFFAQIGESIPGLTDILSMYDELINRMWPVDNPIFMKVKVRDYLFDGIKMFCFGNSTDIIEALKWKFLCAAYEYIAPPTAVKLNDGQPGVHTFSYFRYRKLDGPYEVRLGINEPKTIGEILTYRGKPDLGNTWGGKTCNRLTGTDSTIYRPYLHDVDSLSVFNRDICRIVKLTFSEEVDFNGVPGRRYVIDADNLASVEGNRENYCFCPRSVMGLTTAGGCLRSGVLELSSCQGAPIIMSYPHFFGADPFYQKMVHGLSPNESEHQIFIDIEPHSGYPLRGSMKGQMNIFLKKVPQIRYMKNFPNKLIPVLWLDEGVELSDDLVDEIKGKLVTPLFAFDIVFWLLIAFGIVILAACVVNFFREQSQAAESEVTTLEWGSFLQLNPHRSHHLRQPKDREAFQCGDGPSRMVFGRTPAKPPRRIEISIPDDSDSRKKRKPLSSRGRPSDSYRARDPIKKLDRESASKEFNETMETIKKYADNGSLPQIYDPLKSCFEVLKPFHLSDLDTSNDFEQYFLEFAKKNDSCLSDVSSAGDASEKKSQKVFIPPLNLSQKNGSDGTDSEADLPVPAKAASQPKAKSPGKQSHRSEPAGKKQPEEVQPQNDNSQDTSFEYRFLSSDEKTQSDAESYSGSSKKSKSGRRSDRNKQPMQRLNSAGDHGNNSPKNCSARSKKSRYYSSSSDEMEEDILEGGHPNKMTDSQVTQELRLADERATRTVKMIEQIREAIAAYQEKDTMTEEENRELKRNQQKLSKNLHQLEKITSRVKQLVGLADKSFKKKWEELEKSDKTQVEDLKAGGDTVELSEQAVPERAQRRKESPRESPRDAEAVDGEEKAVREPEEEYPVASTRSETSTGKDEAEAKSEAAEEAADAGRSARETPRTRLKKDLQKLREELNEDFDDSEMDTTDDVDSPTVSRAESVGDGDKEGEAVKRLAPPTRREDPPRLLLPTESLETKMSKILAGEAKPLAKVQSISALESISGFKTPSLPSVDSDTKSVPEVMLSLTGRLSESYSMQEKLAAENADLEGLRYQLQEELITKENAVELLQRKVANLQAEMRLMVRENAQLNDRLLGQGMNPPYEDKVSVKVVPPTQDDIVDMKLDEYRETTQTLESTVCTLEAEVKRIQQELQAVQKERQDLENHRKMMKININVQRRGMGTHGGLINPLPPRDSNTELQVREIKEQYDRLQQDFNNKLLEVASLRAQNDKLMEITDKAREEKDYCEEQCKSLEKRLKQLEGEKTKMLGSKEQLFELEQQMSVIKARYREAQDEIYELKNQLDDQTAQLDDYRNKYLQAQQQVEEQIRQIDHMELENQRAREEQNAELQRVKQCFQEKLSELTPLADILKETQMKLQEAQQLRMIAERNLEDLQRELQDSKERSNTLLRRIESERSTQQLGLDERSQMAARLESWEKKCNELRDENAKLRTTVVRLEEASAQNEKRLDEKLHEVAQFSNQLETLREESARQVARCKDRNETVKRSLQNQIADLERQLAQARATARTAQKDKDEIRQRMQTQINNLNDNFEQAQLRIKSLQSHVNFLKNSYSGMFTPEPSTMSLVDSASGFLIEPPCNPCDCTY